MRMLRLALVLALVPLLAAPVIPRRRVAAGGGGGTDFTADAAIIGCWAMTTTLTADSCGSMTLTAFDGGTAINTTSSATGDLPPGTPTGSASFASMDLDGTNDAFYRADETVWNVTDFSICGWARTEAEFTSGQTAFSHGFALFGPGFSYRYQDSDACIDGVCEEPASGSTLNWRHICITYDDAVDQVVIYENGVNACSGGCAAQTAADFDATERFVVGGRDDSGTTIADDWNGAVYEVGALSRSLSADEVCQICRCGFSDGVADRGDSVCSTCSMGAGTCSN